MSVYLVSNLATTPDTPPAAGSPCSVTGCGCVHRVTRYPSDTTDAEWEVLEPHAQAVMAELRRGPGGRPMAHRLRAVVDAVRYLVRYGIEWRALPADFPPWQAVYAFFERWAQRGLPQRIVDRLRDQLRVGAGRAALPTAAVIDSQTVRGADTVGAATSGYDGGKKIKGRKRHIAVDTNGWLLTVLVTAASVQDRDAGHRLLALLREKFSTITLVWADGGYAGRLVTWATAVLSLAVTVVKRTDDVRGFVVLPRRWVVEICQAQCTHGVWCCAVSAVSVQMRRLYQPGGRVRRSRSSASSRWSAWAMRRWGQQLSRRVVIQPRLIQA
ncbi:IS5 family transposase [Streptomyces sp. SP17KL33]|uniref:IS5 family transposase n=1 Tax=Streptomyces sp. SP17KL33 TaxID=3002534 RepID=UPI002E77CE2E|nr:IS5 family transposase [Streptomyces sp. SP17KL33]MEE1830049.1 IS5 family transposase [Streptomyces sp. SP17KL33]